MQSLSFSQSRPSILVRNYSDHKGRHHTYSMKVGFNLQWDSMLRTKGNAFLAKGNGEGGCLRYFNSGRRRNEAGIVMAAAKAKDHYSTLKVPKTASQQDIKASYRKLARKYHPDMNKSPGAEAKFKEIGAAYEVLADEEKRSLYDQHGEAGVNGEYGDSTAGPPEVSPFDLFESIFFRGRGIYEDFGDMGGTSLKFQNGGHQQGDDIRFELSLSLKEAFFGVKKDIEYSCLKTCGVCMGRGAKSFASINTCQDCGGKGHIKKTQRATFVIISQVSTCSRCRGEGKLITDPCHRCGGDGRVWSKKTKRVKIPPGISSDITLELSGEGHSGPRGGPAGDLYVVLEIQEVQGIKRDGVNLHSKITINYTEAILGTVIKVETVEGLKTLEIPAGTQPGDVLVMQNMGFPELENPSMRGNHFFEVNIFIPKTLSNAERKLVEELAHLHGSKSFFSSFSQGIDQSSQREQKKKASTENEFTATEDKKIKSFWDSMQNKTRWKSSKNKFSCMSLQEIVSEEYPLVASSNLPLICHFFPPPLYFLAFVYLLCLYVQRYSSKSQMLQLFIDIR